MNNTVALNMIVGFGESEHMKKCLETVNAKKVFDEIVICHASDNIDTDVVDTAKKWTDNIVTHKWSSERYPYGNFALARNACINATKSDVIFWLDCDDILRYSDRLNNLIMNIRSNDVDFYMAGYLINKLKNGTFATRFMKERIFKNRKDIRWEYPVHEQLSLKNSKRFVNIKGLDIEHDSNKKSPMESIRRNLNILEHELKVDPCNHTYLFYANELLSLYRVTKDENDLKKAIEQMEYCIRHRLCNNENLATMCYNISMALIASKDVSEITDEMNHIAELYAHISISFSNKYAEPYIVLGSIKEMNDDFSGAIECYKKAMDKKLDGISFQTPIYYMEYPSVRLTELYLRQNNLEYSLLCSKVALQCNPNNKAMHMIRKNVLNQLLQKEEMWLIMS